MAERGRSSQTGRAVSGREDEDARSALLERTVESQDGVGRSRAAAEDAKARVARRQACETVTTGFERLGESLRVAGNLFGPQRVDATSPFGNGDDGLVALGYLSEAAAALLGGARALLERGNLYSGSALLRQLVEVEYLAWAFAEDEGEAQSWLRSSQGERRNLWQPRHLRDRSQGRFRGSDYGRHCEIGGHPSPPGVRVLLGGDRTLTAEPLLSDTVNHGFSAWHYMLAGVEAACYKRLTDTQHLIPERSARAVRDAERRWLHDDHLRIVWGELSEKR